MYIAFEGMDGSGKSSVAHIVYDTVRSSGWTHSQVDLHGQPGATNLGAFLRRLVKEPRKIDPGIILDEHTRQILYMADASAFHKLVLEPALTRDEFVISDRCSLVSIWIYGTACGLSWATIQDLVKVVPMPRIPLLDKLYVLTCPAAVAAQRRGQRDNVEFNIDHFDNQPSQFMEKIAELYKCLASGVDKWPHTLAPIVEPKNVVALDATLPCEINARHVMVDLFEST